MSNHTIVASHPVAGPINIDFRFSPGRAAVMYLRNGDPGYPAEPAEVEYLSNDAGQGFNSWAEAWLADHEDEAIELAEEEGP